MIPSCFSIVKPVLSGLACAKITNGEKEISIACDDLGGYLDDLRRTDMRLFRGGNEATHEVWPDAEMDVPVTLYTLEQALVWLTRA